MKSSTLTRQIRVTRQYSTVLPRYLNLHTKSFIVCVYMLHVHEQRYDREKMLKVFPLLLSPQQVTTVFSNE